VGGSTSAVSGDGRPGPVQLDRALVCQAVRYPGAVIEDLAERVNEMPSGWVKEMGLTILAASAEEVTCEWEVTEKHHQGYGIVHGGVYCGVIETLASIGAAIVAHPRGQHVAGLENSTSFIRAVRSGRLHAVARPVTRGRLSQVWEAWIRDDEDRLVAQGHVRLICFDAQRPLG
jgi:1,4-dihydroxy-2-naphthoyl-CoA hydrolase